MADPRGPSAEDTRRYSWPSAGRRIHENHPRCRSSPPILGGSHALPSAYNVLLSDGGRQSPADGSRGSAVPEPAGLHLSPRHVSHGPRGEAWHAPAALGRVLGSVLSPSLPNSGDG